MTIPTDRYPWHLITTAYGCGVNQGYTERQLKRIASRKAVYLTSGVIIGQCGPLRAAWNA